MWREIFGFDTDRGGLGLEGLRQHDEIIGCSMVEQPIEVVVHQPAGWVRGRDIASEESAAQVIRDQLLRAAIAAASMLGALVLDFGWRQ